MVIYYHSVFPPLLIFSRFAAKARSFVLRGVSTLKFHGPSVTRPFFSVILLGSYRYALQRYTGHGSSRGRSNIWFMQHLPD
jgi:hypothetical protein